MVFFDNNGIPGEAQSQFSAGLELAKEIHQLMMKANESSHYVTMQGVTMWWLYLQDIDRLIAPRLKKEEHKTQLEKVRVVSLPSAYTRNPIDIVLHQRKKLTKYQETLTFLVDKLGLGFKAGDDPSSIILR